MKASGLNGEYCMNCASILDDVQRTYKRVIVLDSQCAAVFQQSGDANRLEENVQKYKPAQQERLPPQPVSPKHVEEPKPEAVKEEPKEEPKPKVSHKADKPTGRKK